jgi:hypothetical protein
VPISAHPLPHTRRTTMEWRAIARRAAQATKAFVLKHWLPLCFLVATLIALTAPVPGRAVVSVTASARLPPMGAGHCDTPAAASAEPPRTAPCRRLHAATLATHCCCLPCCRSWATFT